MGWFFAVRHYMVLIISMNSSLERRLGQQAGDARATAAQTFNPS